KHDRRKNDRRKLGKQRSRRTDESTEKTVALSFRSTTWSRGRPPDLRDAPTDTRGWPAGSSGRGCQTNRIRDQSPGPIHLVDPARRSPRTQRCDTRGHGANPEDKEVCPATDSP